MPDMETSTPRPQVLFIDGLPGSGKSTAAEAVGGRLPSSRVFLESAPNHPLLVAAPDQMGAAFADIHKMYSGDSFAAAALGRLKSFLESARREVLYVFLDGVVACERVCCRWGGHVRFALQCNIGAGRMDVS